MNGNGSPRYSTLHLEALMSLTSVHPDVPSGTLISVLIIFSPPFAVAIKSSNLILWLLFVPFFFSETSLKFLGDATSRDVIFTLFKSFVYKSPKILATLVSITSLVSPDSIVALSIFILFG